MVEKKTAANRDQWNIVWDSQSKNSSESMPCGGHDIGLNVWVENGDVLFYIDRSGSFDENNQMLKLGRVRLRLSPNPFSQGGTFQQELDLSRGCVRITGSTPNAVDGEIEIWVETQRPAIHVEISLRQLTELNVWYENWRTSEREVPLSPPYLRHPCLSYYGYPGKVTMKPDTVEFSGDQVVFYHRNRNDSLLVDKLIEQQGLSAVREQIPNLQKDFTFGGCMRGKGMQAAGTVEGKYIGANLKGWQLRSAAPARRHDVDLFFCAGQMPDLRQWHDRLGAVQRESDAQGLNARMQTLQWWDQFWQRSYIRIQPDAPAAASKPWQVGRNYQLFRYMLGCNAYGAFPTKFNGGLFTFDPSLAHENPELENESPDYRQWGGGSFTAQNQRLVYWPMLKSGDFEMMRPQFEYYSRALSAAEARTKVYWGHGGCSFTEQLENCGLPIGWGWGWPNSDDKFHRREPLFDLTEQVGPWIRYEYSTQLEFALMILRCHEFSGRDISPYLPLIKSAARFYDEHYQYRHFTNTVRKLDAQGHLVIFPSTALETYKDATNPIDAVSGLRTLVEVMLELIPQQLSGEEIEYFKGLLDRIPPITFREMEGHKTIAPAKSWSDIMNIEIPQLYPVFPHDRYRLGGDDIQVAIDTWRFGVDSPDQRGYVSWHQDNIFCARLGLTKEAAELAIKKLQDGKLRFPAFWGPGHDWTPDHNWGGSGMIGLQEMLMQTFGREILLLPAWPRDWDVDFKLHAPLQTTVEGKVRGGKVVELRVTPTERAGDVVNFWDRGD